MRKTILSIGIAMALVLIPVTPALAGHGGAPISVHKTYEVGPTFAASSCVTGSDTLGTGCDPTGQTQDGSIDYGGAVFVPDDVPDGVDSVQASVVDDVYGAGVSAGFICTDENDNNICGEGDQGEVRQIFCGTSSVSEIPPAPNWDAVVVFVSFGWAWQYTDCDPTAAPTDTTTGGVINPAGGIFATFG